MLDGRVVVPDGSAYAGKANLSRFATFLLQQLKASRYTCDLAESLRYSKRTFDELLGAVVGCDGCPSGIG